MDIHLAVWRETSRSQGLTEAVGQLMPMLRRRLPLAMLLVRRLDSHGLRVETIAGVAAREGDALPRARSEVPPERLAAVVEWCRRGGTAGGADDPHSLQVDGLIPEGLSRANVLLVGLAREGASGAVSEPRLGVLVFVAAEGRGFSAEDAELARGLAEPFAVALANDCRLRELQALREAAEAEKRTLLTRLGRGHVSDIVVGERSGLASVMERVELVAKSQAPVLLLGETGTGKEVVARALHLRSPRAQGPMLRVNCGAIPAELVDSELFGHEKGSFTGATGLRKGWFERADGGTLFLDEIGELPPAAQVRLLRVLQDGTFERVGGHATLSVDVRVVAATHCDLHEMVRRRAFREDLWYRISVFPIALPPLRERLEDIPALATHFSLKSATRLGLPVVLPSQDQLTLLATYPWPGNIRELASVIERAAILGNGHRLEIAKALGIGGRVMARMPLDPPSPELPGQAEKTAPRPRGLDEVAADYIRGVLKECRGRIEGPFGAARTLGVNPHTLRARMRKLGIDWAAYRAG